MWGCLVGDVSCPGTWQRAITYFTREWIRYCPFTKWPRTNYRWQRNPPHPAFSTPFKEISLDQIVLILRYSEYCWYTNSEAHRFSYHNYTNKLVLNIWNTCRTGTAQRPRGYVRPNGLGSESCSLCMCCGGPCCSGGGTRMTFRFPWFPTTGSAPPLELLDSSTSPLWRYRLSFVYFTSSGWSTNKEWGGE